MQSNETPHSIGERQQTQYTRVSASRTIDCGDGVRASAPSERGDPEAGLAHAAFALARNGPKFGSSARSFGEQHQAI